MSDNEPPEAQRVLHVDGLTVPAAWSDLSADEAGHRIGMLLEGVGATIYRELAKHNPEWPTGFPQIGYPRSRLVSIGAMRQILDDMGWRVIESAASAGPLSLAPSWRVTLNREIDVVTGEGHCNVSALANGLAQVMARSQIDKPLVSLN